MDQGALPHTPDLIALFPGPIDPAALVAHVSRADAGAVVVFLGTVRDHSEGREGVTALDYEAYEGAAEAEMERVVSEARGRWDLGTVALAHRVGRLVVGEVSVGVAVSSAHRPEAFEAARFMIDELKAGVPIWKKEHWADGSEWV
jgi:molybdopterin synthase catalytic subunit